MIRRIAILGDEKVGHKSTRFLVIIDGTRIFLPYRQFALLTYVGYSTRAGEMFRPDSETDSVQINTLAHRLQVDSGHRVIHNEYGRGYLLSARSIHIGRKARELVAQPE